MTLQLLPFAYLLLSLVLLFGTASAIAPRALGHTLSSALGLVGLMLAFGLPQYLVLSALTTAAAAHYGALATFPGQAGLWVHAVCWVILLAYMVRMHRAIPVLDGVQVHDADHPFTAKFTEDERAQLRPGQVSWRPSLTYRTAAMADVEVVRSVVYREIAGVRLKLDVYRPRSAEGPLPAALYIHGGGWIVGTRRQSRFMMYELASAGWVVFAISYRLSPRFPLPAAVEDCKSAVAWIREHGELYGADPSKLVVMGGSAGGHLAALVALTPNLARFQPGFEGTDTRVQGAVVLYGVTDFVGAFHDRPHPALATLLERAVVGRRYREDEELFHALSPASYCSSEAPPLLLVHGTADTVVPTEESRLFARRLREAGAKSVHLLEVPMGVHAFEVMPTPLHQRAVRVIVRFMDTLRPGTP